MAFVSNLFSVYLIVLLITEMTYRDAIWPAALGILRMQLLFP